MSVPVPMSMSWKKAIAKVLLEANSPLRYSEISEKVLSQGYYKTDSANPAAIVNTQVSSSIRLDGEKSPFIRVGKGVFSLRSKLTTPQEASKASLAKVKAEKIPLEDEIEASDSIIRSFGMYWQRDLVVWKNAPKMYGQQQASAKSVDFGAQKGIYILYDHHTVVYVGRSIDRPLGKRLFEHTLDRLGSRWNRFSWFGLLDVTNEGGLREVPVKASLAALVATLESLLIEALEPPQNRKRGDDFSTIEYIQDLDPELKEREIKNTLRAIEQKLRGGA